MTIRLGDSDMGVSGQPLDIVDRPVLTIDVEPTSQEETAPDPATFALTASATESATIYYLWQRLVDGIWSTLSDAGVFSGTRTDTLAISDTTGLNGAQFRCYIGGSGGALPVVSDTVTLTVNDPE